MKTIMNVSVVFIAAFFLSGCMYPKDRLAENRIPYEDQIQSVQNAVDNYQEATNGLLPIKTRDMETPIYLKYPIEFSKLAPQFLSGPPGNAYESGGVFQYVLINVEENPTVKVFDLRIAEKIRELKMRIQAQGYPPFKDAISDNVYTLDYEKLGYKGEQYIISPYTNNNLPLIISGQGELYVDYISDLFLALQENGQKYEEGEDILHILAEQSPVVPAYALPYTVNKHNEPIYMPK
ncbi:hypothetical protein [Lederbergia citrea]